MSATSSSPKTLFTTIWNLEIAHVVALVQYLYERVGIGYGRRLGRCDDKGNRAGPCKQAHRIRKSCAKVKQHKVVLLCQWPHALDELLAGFCVELGLIACTRGSRQYIQPRNVRVQDACKIRSSLQDIPQCSPRRKAHEHVHIGKPKVTVQDQHSCTCVLQGKAQVQGYVALADTALAA